MATWLEAIPPSPRRQVSETCPFTNGEHLIWRDSATEIAGTLLERIYERKPQLFKLESDVLDPAKTPTVSSPSHNQPWPFLDSSDQANANGPAYIVKASPSYLPPPLPSRTINTCGLPFQLSRRSSCSPSPRSSVLFSYQHSHGSPWVSK